MTHRGFPVILLSTILVCASEVAAQEPVIYTDNRAPSSTFRDRGPSYAPTYLIYVDKQRNADQAKQLVEDVGLAPHLDEYDRIHGQVLAVGFCLGRSQTARAP